MAGFFRNNGDEGIPPLFNRVLNEHIQKDSFVLSDVATAFAAELESAKTALTKTFDEKNIEEGNPIAGGTKEIAAKLKIDVITRFLMYLAKGWPDEAANRVIAHLEDQGNADILDALYDSLGSILDPVIPPSTYEETYFTRYEFRQFASDQLSFNTSMGDYTDQIQHAYRSGTVRYPVMDESSSNEAVRWMVYFMYYERAFKTIAVVASDGDGITDIPNAALTRAEFKDLLEKEKKKEIKTVEEALRLAKLREAAASGDLTNIDEDVDSEDDLAQRLRFSEQTILMRNLKSFALNYTALLKRRKEKYEKTYLMFGEPSEMVNKLTLKPGMSTFLNFRTDEISQLAPKFKLYQVTYDKDNKNPRETEYKFANRNNIQGSDSSQANILESRGREAVGVKSFEWKYIGTNPATARNDLTAQLQLYFQSFDDLFEKRISVDKDGKVYYYRYVDLILRNPILEGDEVEKSCTVEVDSRPDSEKQKPEKFETKIIVGWNFRGTDLEAKVKADNMKKDGTSTISDLSYFNEVLFMTLIDHDFGIEEDGTFSLTITYRARLDALMQDKRSDVLATTNIIEKRAQFEKQIKEAQKKCEQSEASKEALKKLKDDYESQKTKYRMESYQSIINELNGMGERQNPRSPKVYHISIDLIKFASAGGDLSKGEEYLADANTSGIQIGTEFVQKDLAEKISNPKNTSAQAITTADMVGNVVNDVTENINTVSTVTGIDTPGEALLAGTAVLAVAPVAIASTTVAGAYLAASATHEIYDNYQTNSINSTFETTGELDEEDINKMLKTTVDISGGMYNIHYFFFGDLIELLAQRVLNDDRQGKINEVNVNLSPDMLDNIRILLGTMEWFPRVEGTADNAAYRVNIAALPISLMVYKNFMLRRVVAKKRDIYSLLDFIRDFLKYLLDDVLGANSEDSDESLKLDVEIKSSVITMPGKPAGIGGGLTTDPIADKILENQNNSISLSPETQKGGASKGITLDLDTITEQNTIIPYGDPESNIASRAYHYLTVYVENKTPSHLRGYEEDDRRAGIYHFHIGANKSIFKRANFKKTDATYLREARFTNQQYNPLATLANVYDVDMEMFGNTIFYPGQYLFINPFGLGKSIGLPWDCNSFSNIMGLGGYHLVTEVSSVMDEDGFSTTVQARYETSGDGKKYDSRSDTNNPNCEAPQATEIK
jgi:hypothetical protein